MKKVLEFIKDNASVIVAIIVCGFLLGTIFLPFFIAIARITWDIALNNPTAIM